MNLISSAEEDLKLLVQHLNPTEDNIGKKNRLFLNICDILYDLNKTKISIDLLDRIMDYMYKTISAYPSFIIHINNNTIQNFLNHINLNETINIKILEFLILCVDLYKSEKSILISIENIASNINISLKHFVFILESNMYLEIPDTLKCYCKYIKNLHKFYLYTSNDDQFKAVKYYFTCIYFNYINVISALFNHDYKNHYLLINTLSDSMQKLILPKIFDGTILSISDSSDEDHSFFIKMKQSSTFEINLINQIKLLYDLNISEYLNSMNYYNNSQFQSKLIFIIFDAICNLQHLNVIQESLFIDISTNFLASPSLVPVDLRFVDKFFTTMKNTKTLQIFYKSKHFKITQPIVINLFTDFLVDIKPENIDNLFNLLSNTISFSFTFIETHLTIILTHLLSSNCNEIKKKFIKELYEEYSLNNKMVILIQEICTFLVNENSYNLDINSVNYFCKYFCSNSNNYKINITDIVSILFQILQTYSKTNVSSNLIPILKLLYDTVFSYSFIKPNTAFTHDDTLLFTNLIVLLNRSFHTLHNSSIICIWIDVVSKMLNIYLLSLDLINKDTLLSLNTHVCDSPVITTPIDSYNFYDAYIIILHNYLSIVYYSYMGNNVVDNLKGAFLQNLLFVYKCDSVGQLLRQNNSFLLPISIFETTEYTIPLSSIMLCIEYFTTNLYKPNSNNKKIIRKCFIKTLYRISICDTKELFAKFKRMCSLLHRNKYDFCLKYLIYLSVKNLVPYLRILFPSSTGVLPCFIENIDCYHPTFDSFNEPSKSSISTKINIDFKYLYLIMKTLKWGFSNKIKASNIDRSLNLCLICIYISLNTTEAILHKICSTASKMFSKLLKIATDHKSICESIHVYIKQYVHLFLSCPFHGDQIDITFLSIYKSTLLKLFSDKCLLLVHLINIEVPISYNSAFYLETVYICLKLKYRTLEESKLELSTEKVETSIVSYQEELNFLAVPSYNYKYLYKSSALMHYLSYDITKLPVLVFSIENIKTLPENYKKICIKNCLKYPNVLICLEDSYRKKVLNYIIPIMHNFNIHNSLINFFEKADTTILYEFFNIHKVILNELNEKQHRTPSSQESDPNVIPNLIQIYTDFLRPVSLKDSHILSLIHSFILSYRSFINKLTFSSFLILLRASLLKGVVIGIPISFDRVIDILTHCINYAELKPRNLNEITMIINQLRILQPRSFYQHIYLVIPIWKDILKNIVISSNLSNNVSAINLDVENEENINNFLRLTEAILSNKKLTMYGWIFAHTYLKIINKHNLIKHKLFSDIIYTIIKAMKNTNYPLLYSNITKDQSELFEQVYNDYKKKYKHIKIK